MGQSKRGLLREAPTYLSNWCKQGARPVQLPRMVVFIPRAMAGLTIVTFDDAVVQHSLQHLCEYQFDNTQKASDVYLHLSLWERRLPHPPPPASSRFNLAETAPLPPRPLTPVPRPRRWFCLKDA